MFLWILTIHTCTHEYDYYANRNNESIHILHDQIISNLSLRITYSIIGVYQMMHIISRSRSIKAFMGIRKFKELCTALIWYFDKPYWKRPVCLSNQQRVINTICMYRSYTPVVTILQWHILSAITNLYGPDEINYISAT